MDSESGTKTKPKPKPKPKLDELSREQLIQLLGEAIVRIDNLSAKVSLLEKQLTDKNPTVKLPVPFSLKSEEQRRKKRQKQLDDALKKRSHAGPVESKPRKRLPKPAGIKCHSGQILFTVFDVVWKGRRRQIAARFEVRAGCNEA